MADFELSDVDTIATRLGVSPDYVRGQLQAEGHNILTPAPAPAPPPMPAGSMRATAEAAALMGGAPPPGAAAPQPSRAPAPGGMRATAEAAPALGGATPPGFEPGPLQLPEQTITPGTGARGGVRARGLARPQPAQGGGQGASYGRARKLLDAREQQLGAEYQDATKQYNEGAARLSLLDDERMSFAQQKADIESVAAEKRAGIAAEQARIDQEAIVNEQKARAREDEVLKAREAKLEDGRREYVNMKVQGPTLGGRLQSAIAVALATYGDAISRSGGIDSNYAASTQAIVNDAMDRGINEQLRQIDAKGSALNAEEQAIVRMRGQFSDDAAFRDYLRSAQRDVAVAKLEELAAQTTNETTKLAAQSLITDWKSQAETEAQAGRGAALEEARKRLRSAADDRFGFELGIAMPKGDGKKATPAAGGLMQMGDATPEDRKKAQEIASKFGGVVSTLDDLRDMSKRYPSGSLDQTARNFVALKLEDYMGQNSQAFGKGTPQEAEAGRQLARLTDPTAVFTTADAEQLYDMLTQSTLRNADAQMRPYNFSMVGDDSGFEVE